MLKKEYFLLSIGAAIGAILALYANTHHIEQTFLEQLPVTQQEVLTDTVIKMPMEDPIKVVPMVVKQVVSQPKLEPEEWYGTDRKLTDFEWDALSQMIMAEARGESFEVQYYIACVVLNRVDSALFPSTVAGVIYQTQPIQFYGAWDTEQYEPTDAVLEAIQLALEENRSPSDLFYFTSGGWLPGTEPWVQIGGMWFSRQGD